MGIRQCDIGMRMEGSEGERYRRAQHTMLILVAYQKSHPYI